MSKSKKKSSGKVKAKKSSSKPVAKVAKKVSKPEAGKTKEIFPKSSKAKANAPIDPRTGTRFAPGSSRQMAFDIVYKLAVAGKTVKQIRDKLRVTRKDEGSKFDLDAGYLSFVCACHPEFFRVFKTAEGTIIKVVKHPKPDKGAAKKLESDLKVKRSKAKDAQVIRKKKHKESTKEKSGYQKPKIKEDDSEEKSQKYEKPESAIATMEGSEEE